MKQLKTETTTRGKAPAHVYDYPSGSKIGVTTADWDDYRLWASGHSDVCQAKHCLSAGEIDRLGISGDTVIFLLD